MNTKINVIHIKQHGEMKMFMVNIIPKPFQNNSVKSLYFPTSTTRLHTYPLKSRINITAIYTRKKEQVPKQRYSVKGIRMTTINS